MKNIVSNGVMVLLFSIHLFAHDVDVWNEDEKSTKERFENIVESREFVAVLFYNDAVKAQSLVEIFKQVKQSKQYRRKVYFVVADSGEYPYLSHIIASLGITQLPAVVLFQDGTIIRDAHTNASAILNGPFTLSALEHFLDINLSDRITRVTYERSYPRNDMTLDKDTWAQNKMPCDQKDPWYYWNYPYNRGLRGGNCGPGVGGFAYD